MTDHKNNPASFTADRETVNTATHYRNADGAVLKIARRERCGECGGVICIVTTKDKNGNPTRATFTRLHLACVEEQKRKLTERGLWTAYEAEMARLLEQDEP